MKYIITNSNNYFFEIHISDKKKENLKAFIFGLCNNNHFLS